ncbi:hypothetical protein TrCOL_g13461 [Triparma columacea]|uniref:Uncharacterized protein n=1 Tax=Triparma columacea TaxID=722753 RepID=A0A9W7GIZ0_9STRA|nr:hypothetical protein TrCOL_g13461 [Triparma columacea]
MRLSPYFISLFSLLVPVLSTDTWSSITSYSQDLSSNPFLTPTDTFEWILGDPSILDVPNGDRYVLANEIFHGIIVYKRDSQEEGEFTYIKVSPAVKKPGAVRPYCFVEDGVVYLFWEQYTLRSFYANSVMMMKTGSVSEDGVLEWNKDETVVLEPELPWEKENSERVGNAFVTYNEKAEKYFLYYSASSQMLPDSQVAEPIHLGLATAEDIRGPWVRASNEPLKVSGLDSIEGEETTGVGSFKLVKGITQNNDDVQVGLINRITKNKETGATGSTISMVVSRDNGKSLDVVEPNLITPTLIPKDWKESYVYGFDSGADFDDGDKYVLVMYNGRDGWAHARETVGATRVEKTMFTKYL